MKKLLAIIVLGLLFSGNAYADDSYEAAFNVALKNHQYYFKHNGKTYTTNTKEKPFDFFDHGYNYHEASIYMKNNYTDPSDGNYGCMLYNGHLYQFQNSDQMKHNYLDYDKNGWKKTTFEKSKDGLVTAVLTEAPTCLGASNYFQVYFDNKEIFDSRPDFKKWTSKDWLIGLNINSYIGKDYNQNGVKELFIDAGYRLGNTWTEKYYFFEYDLSTITLKKSLLADDQKKRLNISEHFQNKFSVSEEELIKVITKNFSGDTPNKKKKINTKMFSSSLTGLSFSLTDDWYLSSEASAKELGDKLSGERKEYLQSMLKKSKVSRFEVLYNEKFVPDVITITRLNMPRNFSITKNNVKKNCKEIIKVNERATGKKGTLYDCKYVQNRVSGYEGALYISHKDDISTEEGTDTANQIIFIINSQAVYFSTSCKKYCKEVTENIYAISSTLKKN